MYREKVGIIFQLPASASIKQQNTWGPRINVIARQSVRVMMISDGMHRCSGASNANASCAHPGVHPT